MRILTPTGYRDIADCVVGDDVCAFDMETGAPIVNQIESIQLVDATEWARWWSVEPTVPPFVFYKINGEWTLNSEQSIWRNANNVCHARDLIVGDVVFSGSDTDITITSIEEVTAPSWYRLEITGDHSYIADGLTLHNASRFWVGGTASWTAINTTPWAASTGGAGGQTVPGSADTATFDGASGGGTVTVNFGGTITLISMTSGAFTGTLDFSANNNSVTLSGNVGMNMSGSGTRTLNLGNGTWTIQGNSGTNWNASTTTGLTFNANSSTISFTGTGTGTRIFAPGGLTYATVSVGANSSSGSFAINAATTITTLNVTAPNCFVAQAAATLTVTNALNISGSSGSEILFLSSSLGTTGTISSANNGAFTWSAFRDLTFSGGGTFSATSSFDLGHNSGITITAPSAGGGLIANQGMAGGMAA